MFDFGFPLSLWNVEDVRLERGIEVSRETVWFWWVRFGPIFTDEIRRKRAQRMRAWLQWKWQLDETFVRVNGETHTAIPRRWVVERTPDQIRGRLFTWLGRCRTLAKDWKKTIASAECWLLIAHIRWVTRHLARN